MHGLAQIQGVGSQIEKWPVVRFANKKSIFTNKIKNVASRWLNFAGIFVRGRERWVLE